MGRPFRAFFRPALVCCGLGVLCVAAAGCAVGVTKDGRVIFGADAGAIPGTVAHAGDALATGLTLFGVPAPVAASIGGVASTVIASIFAVKKHGEAAERKGEANGYTQAQVEFGAAGVAPVAVAPRPAVVAPGPVAVAAAEVKQ